MLSLYSAQSLAFLLEIIPDLRPLVTEQADWFEINTVSPSGWEFWVSSAEDEITVGFAEYHTHFGWHEGDPADDGTDAADFICSLRTGQLMLAVWYEGEEYVSSWPVESIQEALPKTWFQRWWRRKQRLQIKKWIE
ncbi:hypothetical protein ACFST9_17975 [Hymenobacter monticola]|uniref:Uncharacterized protein n=1 Tax=Hymenobacter monticola TaxID=1705399 RepID=A0ABY4B098_9BACT|nr:hypothetical protein [Hymenobacter monticola]UOE32204.1 hypothetical protein MTP16_13800 [Hymenobacter monticola]